MIDRVPFTRDVLTRIKNGVTARELGWDDTFYISICRKHGLEPNVYTPKPYTLSEIAATVPIVSPPKKIKSVKSDKSLPPAGGDVVFCASTCEIVRGGHTIKLTPRVAQVFASIVKGTPTEPANGRRIAERLGFDIRGGIGSQVLLMRAKLLRLNLSVRSQGGRINAGYWIADIPTAEFITVKVTR